MMKKTILVCACLMITHLAGNAQIMDALPQSRQNAITNPDSTRTIPGKKAKPAKKTTKPDSLPNGQMNNNTLYNSRKDTAMKK